MAPPVVWAQRPDSVLLTIQLADVTDAEINFEAEKVSFKGKVKETTVETSLDLASEINTEESSWSNTGREIQLKLKKKEEGPYWPTLTKKKMNNIKLDWAKWKDEDELEGAEDLGDFGMGGGGGMPGMGGMGGMPGMGGMGGMPGMDGMGGMDMKALMEQMGGGAGGMGMPDMSGGMPEGDSDDEEPPAMEEKKADA
ncbi:Protein wos2 [Diplonema papillatum]|nr:Protein wos2 [Diplonema papillatum]